MNIFKSSPIWIATTFLLAVALCLQWNAAKRQSDRVTTLQAVMEEQNRALTSYKTTQEKLQKSKSELNRALYDLNLSLAERTNPSLPIPAEAPTTNAAEKAGGDKKGGIGGFLATMMEDPEMRRMMLQQQKGMIETLYAPLYKELGLSEAETEKFKDLILTNQMRNLERASQFMKPTEDPVGQAANVEKMRQSQKEADEEMKAFLGETRFAQYRDYNETMGERVALQQFKQQLATGAALRDDQEFQLQRAMKEEAKNVPLPPGQADQSPEARSWAMMGSDEQMQAHFQRQEEINKRVFERARNVLSEEQLLLFGKFQENQLNMQKMGINMARKMMGPKAAGAPEK